MLIAATFVCAYILFAFIVARRIHDKTVEGILEAHRAENPLPYICSFALRRDVESCQKWLLQGYDPNQRCTIVVSRLGQQTITLEQVSPLMISAQQNDTVMFNLLLQFGASVRCKDFCNRDLLMIASWFSSKDIVRELLICPNGIDWKRNKDTDGNDALYYAQLSGDTEIIAMLCEYGFSTKTPLSSGTHNKADNTNI